MTRSWNNCSKSMSQKKSTGGRKVRMDAINSHKFNNKPRFATRNISVACQLRSIVIVVLGFIVVGFHSRSVPTVPRSVSCLASGSRHRHDRRHFVFYSGRRRRRWFRPLDAWRRVCGGGRRGARRTAINARRNSGANLAFQQNSDER